MVFSMAAHPLHLLFVPHPHNNHKPKLLWSQSILVLLGLLIMGRSLVDIFASAKPGVLGFASQIDPEKVIEITNQERQTNNVPPLVYSKELSEAAQTKAIDMFANNYWAHVSPQGTEPWSFMINAGYTYLHAGENLARDFSNPNDIVVAWMASPTHRRNILDGRYKDIGIAVADGYINGIETTLVVQMFGVRQGSTAEVASGNVISQAYAQDTIKVYPVSGISPFDAKKSWSLALVAIIILALSLDWFFVWKNNLIRISGKSWAHFTFFITMMAIIFIIRQGIVL